MHKLLYVLFTFLSIPAFAQQNWHAAFELFQLPPNSAYVNFTNPLSDVGFTEDNIHFPCYYDTAWGGFWVGGFSYSNVKDSTSSGLSNQYASKAFGGRNSSNYAVAYGSHNSIKLNVPQWQNIPLVYGFYITNNTYAYNAMRDGDLFSKKFGGVGGTDADFFKLTIFGYINGTKNADSVNFYLADFQDSAQANDYIVDTWKWVNLSPIGYADSLSFHLTSSDNGQFGMNTPAYFCIDDFFISYPLQLKDVVVKNRIQVAPNPAVEYFYLHGTEPVQQLMVLDMQGRLIYQQSSYQLGSSIDLSTWPKGKYLVRTLQGENWFSQTLIVK